MTGDEPEVVRIARVAVERFNAGDLDGLLDMLTDDVVAVVPEPLLNTGVYRGRQGFQRMMAAWMEAWEAFTIEPIDYRVEGDRAIVPVRQRLRGRGSGIEVTGEMVYVVTVRDGRLSSWTLYATLEDAAEGA